MGRKELAVILILGIPMLSIAKLGNGHDSYYLNLAAEDYYVAGGEPEGQWLSTAGARALRLSGKVSKDDFHSLFHGCKPDGTPLVQNAKSRQRTPGQDLTFSAPKTVSVLWAMAPSMIRKIIQQCQLEAVILAILYLERQAAFSRRGKAGCRLESAGMVVAAYEHSTSRALDCQLHTHALVLNIATRADGTTGSLQSKPLYEHKMVAGALYRAQLAHLLQERLGLKIVRDRDSFEIAGVPKDLCDYFSKRRQQIVAKLGQKGLETAAAAAAAALDTREAKKVVPPRAELFAQWQEVGARFGFTPEYAVSLLQRTRPSNDPTRAAQIVDGATQTLSNRFSSFTEKDLLREALCAAVEQGFHPDTIRRTVTHHLSHATDILRVPGTDQNPRYTTHQALRMQKQIAQSVKRLTSAVRPAVSHRAIRAALANHAKPRDSTLDELKYHIHQLVRAASGQKTWRIDRDCIARCAQRTVNDTHIASVAEIARSRARIITIARTSSDDRYLVLTCCREAWQRAGYNVVGVSLAKDGVRRLYQETGIDSMSFKRLELMMHPTTGWQVRHHLRMLCRAAREKPTFALEPLQIAKDTVLVVDAAERLSFQQMATLTRDVAKQGGRLVLVEHDQKNPQLREYTALREIDAELTRRKAEEELRQSRTQGVENQSTHNQSQTQQQSRSM